MSYIVTTHIFSYHFVENYSKNVLSIFNPFFSKKVENHVFSLFYPKIRHFSKRQFRVISSLNFLKKYKFEEFLHILPICALQRVKNMIFGRFHPKKMWIKF